MPPLRFHVRLVATYLLCACTCSTSTATQYSLSTLVSFNGLNGRTPQAGVVFDSNGDLYGTTSAGGAADVGTVFKVDAINGALTMLCSFDYSNGRNPQAGVIVASNGMLYGTTFSGGANNNGTLFQLDPTTRALTTLVSFNGANGISPQAELSLDSGGRLYGTTKYGGTLAGGGTVFRYDPSTGDLATLKSFIGTNGAQPAASLLFDAGGKLFGTTTIEGSVGGFGTVFRLDPSSGALTSLGSFNGANGREPRGAMVLDFAGNLYGTTAYGGAFPGPFNTSHGTVFRRDAATGALTTLISFNGSNGSTPVGGLMQATDGNLYGTTALGGEFGNGVVFCLNPATGKLTTLASFNNVNGHFPYGNVVADAIGNLYGTTGFGGEFGYGTVFKLSPVVPDSLPGDYNQNGVVDAADYVVWRKTGINGQQGYEEWRFHFGQTSGSGSVASANAAVPEPTAIMPLLLATAGWFLQRRRAA